MTLLKDLPLHPNRSLMLLLKRRTELSQILAISILSRAAPSKLLANKPLNEIHWVKYPQSRQWIVPKLITRRLTPPKLIEVVPNNSATILNCKPTELHQAQCTLSNSQLRIKWAKYTLVLAKMLLRLAQRVSSLLLRQRRAANRPLTKNYRPKATVNKKSPTILSTLQWIESKVRQLQLRQIIWNRLPIRSCKTTPTLSAPSYRAPKA